jgi:hypothetical protein
MEAPSGSIRGSTDTMPSRTQRSISPCCDTVYLPTDRYLQANRAEPDRAMIFLHAALMLEIILHSLLALVQCPSSTDNLMQHSDACLESSRKGLQALVKVGQLSVDTRLTAWSKFLNTYDGIPIFHKVTLLIKYRTLSMAPFVPFIALVGNAINTSSREDIALLEAALAVMQPVAVESPFVRSISNECQSLFDLCGSWMNLSGTL